MEEKNPKIEIATDGNTWFHISRDKMIYKINNFVTSLI